MKPRLVKIIVILVMFSLIGGCSSNYLQTKDKKNIIYKKTGQILPKNILCKPSDPDLLRIYHQNEKQLKIPVKDLPSCEKYKINSNKSTGLWDAIFVKPLAFLIIQMAKVLKNYGLSVILLGILIRVILLPFAKKSQLQAEIMNQINPEMQAIERKYQTQTDNDAMMAKAQEMMILYKKYNFNPMSSFLMAFIQLPLFFAFYSALNRIPVIFEDSLFGMYLGTTPSIGIQNGQYQYLILVVLVFLTTYFSFKKTMTTTGNKQQDNQMKYMLIFMLVFIGMASFSLSTAVAFYWIATNGFIAIQNQVFSKMATLRTKKKSKSKIKRKPSSLKPKRKEAKNANLH